MLWKNYFSILSRITAQDDELLQQCLLTFYEEEEREFIGGRLDQRGSGRGSWFFLAAPPLACLAGIVLVLWMGNAGDEGRRCTTSAVVPT
ncbi:hypothetical protein TIFTF001_009879 [Ficus carica]|uniref:Uncharacterized protein n=1 Tax=Ficus carica TaxID=3494 RepID=A0AA88A7P2_FICCA|nr:hypothetical protein TIFTF001_009879 [Ficus carica]